MFSLAEFVLLSLAAARATQFVVFDKLSETPRRKLELWYADKPTSKVRTFWMQLFSCPLCIGFHLSWITVITYLLASGWWAQQSLWTIAIEVWAVAMGQCIANFALDKLSD